MTSEIVLVPFPFDDLSGSKVRVALRLTDPIGPYMHVVVAFVTSRIPIELLDTDVVVDCTDADFAGTGLKVTSVVLLHRLATVSDSLILRRLGELPPGISTEVAEKLRKVFCL